MNERLRKLYEQCFVADNYVNVGPEGPSLGFKFDPDKFAQLIIRDCLDQTKEDLNKWVGNMAYSGTSHCTYDMGYEKSPAWLAVDEVVEYLPKTIDGIAKHYGVE